MREIEERERRELISEIKRTLEDQQSKSVHYPGAAVITTGHPMMMPQPFPYQMGCQPMYAPPYGGASSSMYAQGQYPAQSMQGQYLAQQMQGQYPAQPMQIPQGIQSQDTGIPPQYQQ